MLSRIDRWGNSLGVRIPKEMAEQLALEPKTQVQIVLVDGQILIQPIKKPKYTLQQLLDGLTDDAIHGEVDFGPAVGNEVW
jgi:antitoxin MazE